MINTETQRTQRFTENQLATGPYPTSLSSPIGLKKQRPVLTETAADPRLAPTIMSSSVADLLNKSIPELSKLFVERRRPVPKGLLEALDVDRRQGAQQLAKRIRERYRENRAEGQDRKSTRLNSSHVEISYAVFC